MRVLMCQNNNDSARLQKLRDQLQLGKQLAVSEQEQLGQMLISQSVVFALSDNELGEMTHHVDTGDARPVRDMPGRLPYAMRKELEVQLKQLLDIGYIERSNSLYVFPLARRRIET